MTGSDYNVTVRIAIDWEPAAAALELIAKLISELAAELRDLSPQQVAEPHK